MKRMMMAGGIFGFGMGVALGVAQGSSWSALLWRASVSAYLAGLLFRWWGRIWLRSLQQAHAERCNAMSESPSQSVTPNKS